MNFVFVDYGQSFFNKYYEIFHNLDKLQWFSTTYTKYPSCCNHIAKFNRENMNIKSTTRSKITP